MSHTNGSGSPSLAADAPAAVVELSDACVRFVERGVGVRLDLEAETLPLLDHYLATSRTELRERPEAAALVARAAGAYFGEVVRRRIPSWWHAPGDDPAEWDVCLEPVFLRISPIAAVHDAIHHGEGGGPVASLEVEDEDREAVEARLAELPEVDEEEFYSLATRLEVLEIAVDAIKARMAQRGLGDVAFGPRDYEG